MPSALFILLPSSRRIKKTHQFLPVAVWLRTTGAGAPETPHKAANQQPTNHTNKQLLAKKKKQLDEPLLQHWSVCNPPANGTMPAQHTTQSTRPHMCHTKHKMLKGTNSSLQVIHAWPKGVLVVDLLGLQRHPTQLRRV